MTIIKSGKPPRYRGTCQTCGTVLEVYHNETSIGGHNKFTHERTVPCPDLRCRETIVVYKVEEDKEESK